MYPRKSFRQKVEGLKREEGSPVRRIWNGGPTRIGGKGILKTTVGGRVAGEKNEAVAY